MGVVEVIVLVIVLIAAILAIRAAVKWLQARLHRHDADVAP
jgi:hypothetical protein